MRLLKLSLVAAVCIAGATATTAMAKEKRTLKGNMTLKYNVLPGNAETLSEMFTKGEWYGRVRFNSFLWDWDTEYAGKTKDNWAMGIGGSLEYKTAYWNGLGATAALYTSQNPWHMDKDEVKFVKAGKDTFSRYKVKKDGTFGMTVLAQAYLEYKRNKTSLKVGRQIFESMLTKSNDTKMIPNTFEGYSLTSRYFSGTTIKLAYFLKQKLRDHTSFHDVITFKDANGESWANNDDSAVNKALSYANFVAAGKDANHDLIVAEIANKSLVPNLKIKLNYTMVPEVVALGGIEAHYKIPLGDYNLVPGFRYIKQWDRGADDIGALGVAVANLKGKGVGYDDPGSVDSSIWMARLDLKAKNKIWWARIGYSEVADDADIIAPWRGFPTGGFTRAMAQYNWYANTKTWMVRGVVNLDKAGVVPGLKASLRYAMQDFDDDKPGVQADSNIIHLDLVEKIKSVPGLYLKFRTGIVSGDDDTIAADGKLKKDPSYNEYRFEINYLF
ncbi:OprD family outer membrane porin [Nitratiruptor tergarcus]|uniref:Outer membrane porin, OprD family n=1 Tax=Nitratiruptor tergarcus DSM 16512 TaxID=1069081 RepID=A0A1W1WSE8_9BACT|nr:OprD family outer membrane porin [Nitratiruptor tergarcus]SMC08643.1 outer membrane porin, OprD family [Nitratiruptor tergarcus DSM 16512]